MCKKYFYKTEDGTYQEKTSDELNANAILEKINHSWSTVDNGATWTEVKQDEDGKITNYDVTLKVKCEKCSKEKTLIANKIDIEVKDEDKNIYTLTAHFDINGTDFTFTEEKIIEAHNYKYTQTNEESHSKKCEWCGLESSESHSLIDSQSFNAEQHAKECKDCGYLLFENHVWDENSDDKEKHTCVICHNSFDHYCKNWLITDWQRNGVNAHSHCTICNKEVKVQSTIKDLYDVYKPKNELAYNGGPRDIYVNYFTSTTWNSDSQNEIPAGVHVLIANGHTMTVKKPLTIKGTLEIVPAAELKIEGEVTNLNSLVTVDDENTPGAKLVVNGKQTIAGSLVVKAENAENLKKLAQSMNSSTVVEVENELTLDTDTISALSKKEIDWVIDDGATLTIADGGNFELTSGKTVEIDKGGTMLVKGILGKDLKFEGEGTVELANSDTTQNGQNLEKAVDAGADNIQIDSKTKLSTQLNINNVNDDSNRAVSITGQSAQTYAIEGSQSEIDVENANKNIVISEGCTLNLSNISVESTAKGTDGDPENCLFITEGNLKLDNVNVSTKRTYGVFVKGSNGSLEMTNSNITSDYAPCIGTNARDTQNSKITVTGGSLITKDKNEPAVFLPAKGEATFENCEIKGGTAIEALGLTTLNLRGTTKLEATKDTYTALTKTPGEEASGSALLIVVRKNYSESGTMNVEIDSGVTFIHKAQSTEASAVEVFQDKSNKGGLSSINITHKTESLEYYDGTDSSCTVTVGKGL